MSASSPGNTNGRWAVVMSWTGSPAGEPIVLDVAITEGEQGEDVTYMAGRSELGQAAGGTQRHIDRNVVEVRQVTDLLFEDVDPDGPGSEPGAGGNGFEGWGGSGGGRKPPGDRAGGSDDSDEDDDSSPEVTRDWLVDHQVPLPRGALVPIGLTQALRCVNGIDWKLK